MKTAILILKVENDLVRVVYQVRLTTEEQIDTVKKILEETCELGFT